MRGLLAVPFAMGLALAAYKLFVNLPLSGFPGNLLRDIATWQRVGITLAGLPILFFPTLLVVWIVNQCWRMLAGFLAATGVLSIVFCSFVLWVDSRQMDPSQSYAWDGWWVALFSGAYLATIVYLVATRLASIVRAFKARTG